MSSFCNIQLQNFDSDDDDVNDDDYDHDGSV